jgi:hypothetical protein
MSGDDLEPLPTAVEPPQPTIAPHRPMLILVVAAYVALALLCVLAREQHDQTEQARWAGCYERRQRLFEFSDPAVEARYKAALQCLGVSLGPEDELCLTITFTPGTTPEQISAFSVGVLTGVSVSGIVSQRNPMYLHAGARAADEIRSIAVGHDPVETVTAVPVRRSSGASSAC